MLFKRVLRVIPALLVLAAMVLAACTPAATPIPTPTVELTQAVVVPTSAPTAVPTPALIILKDGLDREVKLAAPPQRILSLAPSNTEILFAVGAGGQVVGRDDFSDYPEAAQAVTSIGSTFVKLNMEAIVAQKPDLVLVAEITSAEQVKALEKVGLTVYWLANPEDFDGLYQNIIVVGQLTGHEADALKLADQLKARVTAVAEKLKGVAARPKVFYELDATDPTKPFTAGTGTFIDTVIRLGGGDNVGAVIDDLYAPISSEELVKQNPDIIVLGDSAFGVTPEVVKQRAGWNAIAAVKNDQIFGFDDNLASRPGPRLVDGLEAMAKLLHPDLFK